MVYKWLKSVRPPICPFCHQKCQKQSYCCDQCQQLLPKITHACYQCALPILKQELDDQNGHYDKTPDRRPSSPMLCGQCLRGNRIQHRSHAPFSYEFPMPEILSALKFHGQLHYAPVLAHLFHQSVSNAYLDDQLPEIIVPVPLHRNRQFQRGFNQSNLLVQRAAKSLSIPIGQNLVARTINTQSQVSLKQKARMDNVRSAFSLNKSVKDLSDTKHIAIFDDIVTTGATTQAIAKLFAKAGCTRIDIWSIARTPN